MTLGISSCLTILIFVDYELNFDSQHSSSERIFRIVQHQEFPEDTYHFNTTPYPLADAVRNDITNIEEVTQTVGLTSGTFESMKSSGVKSVFEESDVMYADANYFKVFDGIKWIAGNKYSAFENPNSIVLTEAMAQKYFDVTNTEYSRILNKTILLDGSEQLSIKGIVKNIDGNSSYRFGLLLPYQLFKKRNERFAGDWSGTHIGTSFVKLKDSQDAVTAQAAINKMAESYLNEVHSKRVNYELQSLDDIHTTSLYGSSPGGYIIPKRILHVSAFVAIFILFLAIANFVNLITAQSFLRAKEVGILKALGSSHKRLVLKFILENSLLIMAALSISVLFIHFGLKKINDFLSIIDLNLKLDWDFIVLILSVGFLTIILATVYPAFIISRTNPIKALKNKATNTSEGINFRKSLVTLQFVIVQIFVIAVIVIGLQMQYFKAKDIGFDSSRVIITPAPDFNKIGVFENELKSISEIEDISFGSGPPMGIDGLSLGTSYRLSSENPDKGVYAEIKIGNENYVEFYDLKLIAGRSFKSTKDQFDQFVVNEELLKSYNWTPAEAVGKKLVINEGEATIVGVVSNYHNNALQYELTPSIIMNWNSYQNKAFIKVKNLNPKTITNIATIWKDSFDNNLYDYQFLTEAIEREYTIENLIFTGFKLFSFLAIGIGVMGLLGLMTFMLLSKSKEIAIRNVLGSTVGQIVFLLSKTYTKPVIISFAIAAPIAYYFLKSYIRQFTYQIDLSIWMFLLGGLITFLVAFAACGFQSLKMAIVKPIKYLRTE